MKRLRTKNLQKGRHGFLRTVVAAVAWVLSGGDEDMLQLINNDHLSSIELTALFLKQSLLDSKRDYQNSLLQPGFPHWDCIVITASSEFQAAGYQKQIDFRKKHGKLPCASEFMVVPDRNNKRVGSAGSTLTVIRKLKEKFGDFSDRKFLVIHAGGNSSRTPQFSALGKLFSPVPTMLDGLPATVFDMLLVTMASIPGRIDHGMMLLSGDALLLFNPLMCDFGSSHAAAISFKEDVETAQNHGVFTKSQSGNVERFLHKQSIQTLRDRGAVDGRNKCNIDTGAVWLGCDILNDLYSLVDSDEKFEQIVNDRVRLSLYGDISFCLTEKSTLPAFLKEKPEGEMCQELLEVRKELFHTISKYNMKLLMISPARFIHFGSIAEIMKLMNRGVDEYKFIEWSKQINSSVRNASVPCYNSVVSHGAKIGDGSYVEVSYVHADAVVGKDCYLSFIDLHDEVIPDHVLLHGLKLRNGSFVCRIMDISDNPKQDRLFGEPIETVAERLNVPIETIWQNGASRTLWDALLYPACETVREAIKASLNLYELAVHGVGDREAWLSSERKSLSSGLLEADPVAVIDWNTRMYDLIQMNRLEERIVENRNYNEAPIKIESNQLSPIQKQWLDRKIGRLNLTKLDDFRYALRLYYYLGVILDDDQYFDKCFKLIRDTVVQFTETDKMFNEQCRITKDEVTVELPLRVNWGGGWTDACPLCLEKGGAVLNVAVFIDGRAPVVVTLKKLPKKKIVFSSSDLDMYGEFRSIRDLQSVGNPFDPFVLQKASLIVTGIIPSEGGNLDAILTRLGGGFELTSRVINVPKGSGLGTSSILAAACVKAIYEFTGIPYDDNKIYDAVFAMEQLMSTGGGWQDQVGGVTPGIKFTTTEASLRQQLSVDHVRISDETKQELSERFLLIYIGQRRLARNILRNVVANYISDNANISKVVDRIKSICVLMRYALEHGNIEQFSNLLSEHWECVKIIEPGSTNTLIEQIIISISDLIDAKFICGAGGGGFLQVIAKKGVTKEMVHARLKDVFMDFPVDVWPCELYYGDESND